MAAVINCEPNMRLKIIIDKFPEEILLQIFGFLDLKSVKNLSLVNKRWHEIITNDISTMKKLPLTIRGDELRENHLIVGELGSKFYKIVFKIINESFNEEMLSKLKAIGTNIHEIEFMNCRVCEPKVFLNILRNFPKVEKLTFKRCEFINKYQKPDTEVLELENLLELVLQDSSLKILSNIGAQLRSLNVEMPCFDEKLEEALNNLRLMDFLYTQTKLHSLTLRNNHSLSLIFAKIKNAEYQFKLTNLSLRRTFGKEGFEQQLMEFLYTQKDSVKVLELRSTFSNDIHELVLNKFENLKTLRMNIRDFPADLKIIDVNKSVTNLSLDGVNRNTVQYCKFLSLFPNITEISFLDEISFEVLSCLQQFGNALTSLSIYSLCCENYQNVKFPALKNLHLETTVFGNGVWSDLVMCNQTIESLSFRFFNKSDDFDANEIKTVCEGLPNLKHLKLAGEMKETLYHFKNMKESIQLSLSGLDIC